MFCRGSLLNRGLRVLVSQDRQRSALHVLASTTNLLLLDKVSVVGWNYGNPSYCRPVAEYNHQCSISHVITRSYITRAHPKPKATFSINKALGMLIKDAEDRIERRKAKGVLNNKEYNHPDETVEILFGLNLDPRKQNQSLRGSISLPHGTGRKLACVVFTENEEVAKAALEMGAKHAGGADLVNDIANGTVGIDRIDRGLATQDIMPDLSKKVARMLGPRGLMPNVKTSTLFQSGDELLNGLKTQIMGKEVMYRTDKEGQIFLPVGKVSFGVEKLLENLGEVAKEIHDAKPEQYGKGKRSKTSTKNPKYLLQSYVSTTQGRGIKLDLRTIDPSSPFFLSDPKAQQTQVAFEPQADRLQAA